MTKIKDRRRAKALAANKPAEKSTEGTTLKKNQKFLIQNFNGVLKSGEMAFVVGRPGAGCTTFLKAVTNVRDGYAGVDGEVQFGSMDAKQAQKYPGQIIFNQEDDTHFPVRPQTFSDLSACCRSLSLRLSQPDPHRRRDAQVRSQDEDAVVAARGRLARGL